ncbi:hypothetical protein [Caulobacter sp. X]|uniref:hypothetical protein n=1 Tax=Caulobacter sp. X TaxID=2048901 RepID=UPI000C154AA6|nr:hypothetical protein [Caulobacter sp. X]PIB96030.1 hypothetical protein CSW60_15865 [Caulobacter sp. X]
MSLFLALLVSAILPGPISGDFDHDGKTDTARIHRAGDGGYVLEISRGAAPGAPARIDLGRSAPNYMVPAENGGVVATVCGKGLGAKTDPCPRASVQVTRGDLLLGASEASEAVLIWDGQTFRQDWLSD